MARLYAQRGRELWCVQLQRPFAFQSPFADERYALWLHVVDPEITKEEREALCDAIAASPCRYAVTSGQDHDLWHDLLDESYLAKQPDGQPQDEDFLMTAGKDTAADAAYFLVRLTAYEDFRARRMLVLVVGGDDEEPARVAAPALTELRDDD